MHLNDIEEGAADLAAKREELEGVEEELEEVIRELRDLPKKAARESKFAKLVGVESVSEQEVQAMEARQQELAERRDQLLDEIEQAEVKLMEAFLSEDLIVPLTPDPEERDREFFFPFREEAAFPHSIGFLGRTLGLGRPLALEGVLIDEDGVRVPIEFDEDASEAMEHVVAAFEQVQNALEVKVPDQGSGGGW